MTRPTKQDLVAAEGLRLRDVVGPDLAVLFCGINPGLYSAAVGHHFARPGNRFWPALYASGFTDRRLTPPESRRLLDADCGLTDLVARATASAEELEAHELIAGRRRLARKLRRYRPRWVAILGISAYRTAFSRPEALLGPQAERLGGARVWVLPNPSGLNAAHQPKDLACSFRRLREAALGGDRGRLSRPTIAPGGQCEIVWRSSSGV
jgi:TDG/mug DNA glycosylase family protein